MCRWWESGLIFLIEDIHLSSYLIFENKFVEKIKFKTYATFIIFIEICKVYKFHSERKKYQFNAHWNYIKSKNHLSPPTRLIRHMEKQMDCWSVTMNQMKRYRKRPNTGK